MDLHVSIISLADTTYHGHVADKREVATAMAEAILAAAIAVFQRGRWMCNVTPWREAALFFCFGVAKVLLKWFRHQSQPQRMHWEGSGVLPRAPRKGLSLT